jgi:hypothetical protein
MGIKEADVVLFLLNDSYAKPTLTDQRQLSHDLKYNPDYIQLFESGDFVAFSKKSKAKYIKSY